MKYRLRKVARVVLAAAITVIVAGIPALVAALMGAYFALAPERGFFRLVGLILTAALTVGTFYAVYTLLPAACRP